MLNCLAIVLVLGGALLIVIMMFSDHDEPPESLRTLIYWLIHDTVRAMGVFPAIYRWLTGPGPKIKRDEGDDNHFADDTIPPPPAPIEHPITRGYKGDDHA